MMHDQGTTPCGEEPESSADGLFEEAFAGYLDRLNSGEMIERGEIEATYPDLASALWEHLEAFRHALESPPENEALGRLGDYRLRREVGRGAMGIVYDAWQVSMNRRVALKVLPSGLLTDLKRVARFEREARLAGRLHHPNVVAVYGLSVDQNTPHYAMEFVEGETLSDFLANLTGDGISDSRRRTLLSSLAVLLARGRRGDLEARGRLTTSVGGEPSLARRPLPFDGSEVNARYCYRVAEAFAGVADGLQHAHESGIVHRDVKPSNLIVDREGRVRILDFGLAREESEERITLSGEVVGTVLYMSPEQVAASRVLVDHRTDVYSLGATLYEMITSRPPLRGANVRETMSHILCREPEPPRAINPRVPADLDVIVGKCLRKDPGDRYATAEALAQDLRRFVRGDPIEARPLTAWERLARGLWRRRRAVAAALVALAVAAAGLAVAAALVWTAKQDAEAALRRARHDLGLARVAVDDLLDRVGSEGFAASPDMEPLRRSLLARAVEFHEAFVAEAPDDVDVVVEAARAQRRVGQIYHRIGQRVEAREAYSSVLDRLRRATARFPSDGRLPAEAADVEALLGTLDDDSVPAGGVLVDRFPMDATSHGVVAVAPVDLDGDRLPDVVALDRWSADLCVLVNRGGRAFERSPPQRVGRDPIRMAAVDLDGDGDADIVTMGHQGSELSVLFNDHGRLDAARHVPLGFVPWGMAAGDFDGDGRAEVATVGLSFRILSMAADGALVLTEPRPVHGLPNSMVATDVDRDGDLDIVIGTYAAPEGVLWTLLGDGHGRFVEERLDRCPALPLYLVSGDFDGDGVDDVAVSDHNAGSLFVAFARDGHFAPGVEYPIGRNRAAVVSADLDGDRDIDLAVTSEEDGTVGIYLNDGGGRFPVVKTFATGGKPFIGAAADLDADGQVDLTFANGTADDVVVMFRLAEFLASR